jgi:UDP-glucose 4-epimerase
MESLRTALVTGATGFLGRHLVRRLVADGWSVRGVTRNPTAEFPVPLQTWDSLWSGGIAIGATPPVLFHCAAFIPPRMEDSSFAGECLESNAILTLRLAESATAAGVKRLVFCSSGAVYGFHAQPVNEETAPNTAQRACFYLSSKLLAECYLERTQRTTGLQSITLRIGSLYGPGMPEKSVIARFLNLARKGQHLQLVNGGTEQFDFVHVSDVVDLLVRAAESTEKGIFNAGSGEATTVRMLAELVTRLSGNPPDAALAGSADVPATGGFAALSMNKSRAAFGTTPTSLEAGLRQLMSPSNAGSMGTRS